MRLEDQEEAFCSNKARLRGDVPHASQEFRDLPKNDDICQNPDEKIDDGNVGYFPPDEDLQEFPESDTCLLYTSPSPRDLSTSRMPSSA